MDTEQRQFSPENKDLPKGRSIEVIMLRHGKQEVYKDPNSELSEEGKKQAEEFALDFVNQNIDRQMVVKIRFSPVMRATQTAEIISETISKKIIEMELSNITLLKDRKTESLKSRIGLDKIMNTGIEPENVVDEWLKNSEQYSGVVNPKEIRKKIELDITEMDKMAKRLAKEGPDIVYIWVTHETAHSSLMNGLTGESLDGLGGNIKHLEPLKVDFYQELNILPQIQFRDRRLEFKKYE